MRAKYGSLKDKSPEELKLYIRAKAKVNYDLNKDRRNEKARSYYHNDKETHYKNTRRYVMKTKYGITPEDYQLMMEKQGGTCYLCDGLDPNGRDLCVDHNHTTGVVRHLLCGPCNRGIGLLKDNPELLRKAASYIESNGGGY